MINLETCMPYTAYSIHHSFRRSTRAPTRLTRSTAPRRGWAPVSLWLQGQIGLLALGDNHLTASDPKSPAEKGPCNRLRAFRTCLVLASVVLTMVQSSGIGLLGKLRRCLITVTPLRKKGSRNQPLISALRCDGILCDG